MGLEQIVEELHVELVVFHDQHSLRHVADPFAGSLLSGGRGRFPRLSLTGKVEGIRFGKANMTAEKRALLTAEAAEVMAIDVLGYLAAEPEILARFLALTGVEPAMLRRVAGEPAFLAGVLDYLLGDERLLVAYAAHAAIPPERIGEARRAFGRETGEWQPS
jgi:hypothetical protein